MPPLVRCLTLFTLLFVFACGADDDATANNPVLGNRYVVREITDKSPVRDFVNDAGSIRSLTENELDSYRNKFSYTDASDDSFIGLTIAFETANTVVYGTGNFATSFTYTVSGNTVTVEIPDESADQVLTIVSEDRLERSAVNYRAPNPSGGTMGADGASYYSRFVEDQQARLQPDQRFTFQTSTWVLLRED